MYNDFPLGALIGLFVDKKGKPGKVFLIGSEARLSPNQDSVFFVKLNLPPAAKVEGEVKVCTSGWLNVPAPKYTSPVEIADSPLGGSTIRQTLISRFASRMNHQGSRLWCQQGFRQRKTP